ncbi:hypothetical protein ACVLD2_000703 [Paenibacillus sp. PvR052]|nr:hypothetical protein [Paenibacillus sp. PvP091]MBP1169230.1 hypothetical protein [Paenibacillus sp. PvR098]MBP2440258.1 hypothetical protein [Paenibacillus sp. PvP052]
MTFSPYAFPYNQFPHQYAGQVPMTSYSGSSPYVETQGGPIQYIGHQPGTIFVPLSGPCWHRHYATTSWFQQDG